MTRSKLALASALAIVGVAVLTACAPNGTQTPAPSSSPANPTPTPSIQAQVETTIHGSASFDEVEAMFNAHQRPVLQVPNGGTLWVTDLPTECVLQADFQYWGAVSEGEEREIGGIGYLYEGDTLAISATDTPVGWSTSARFTCGSGSDLRVEVTS